MTEDQKKLSGLKSLAKDLGTPNIQFGVTSHYNQYEGFEVIEVCEQLRSKDGSGNFNRGNAFKYLARAGWKGDASKEIEDLEKAKNYIQREIDRLRTDGVNQELYENAVNSMRSFARSYNQEEMLERTGVLKDLYKVTKYGPNGQKVLIINPEPCKVCGELMDLEAEPSTASVYQVCTRGHESILAYPVPEKINEEVTVKCKYCGRDETQTTLAQNNDESWTCVGINYEACLTIQAENHPKPVCRICGEPMTIQDPDPPFRTARRFLCKNGHSKVVAKDDPSN